ncbi:MAG: hypothetical protein R6W68_05125 [Ignavibacteriaceae bacterium]
MESKISLRKFPFPFQCALAICSDIDATQSLKRYLELQKFLCTDKATSSGKGVSLEIGNSFWFFRNSGHPGISYFDKLSTNETDFAPYCRLLINSGYIDVLHTYGDFNKGGFHRKFAELSVNEILKHNLEIKTWVNHGNKLNSQNIGGLHHFHGDRRNTDSYHTDLLQQTGIKYFWISQLTHLVGQDSNLTTINVFKNQLQRLLAIKYYKRQVNPFFTNQLMSTVQLEDNSKINAFMRFINPWGKYSYTDAENLPRQINEKVIDELKSNNGYLILYTHLGNYKNMNEILPEKTCSVLRYLADENSKGNIFITTTTRLLTYYHVYKNLKFRIEKAGKEIKINLHKSTDDPISTQELNGFTFYTDDPENTEMYLDNKPLKKVVNPPDSNGKKSISVPWQKLQFPSDLF